MERKGRENLNFIAWIKIQFTSFNAKSTLIQPSCVTLFPLNGVWEREKETLIEELQKPQPKESPQNSWKPTLYRETRAVHSRQHSRAAGVPSFWACSMIVAPRCTVVRLFFRFRLLSWGFVWPLFFLQFLVKAIFVLKTRSSSWKHR